MKPEDAAQSTDEKAQPLASSARLPSRFTPKGLLLTVLTVYGLWLMGLAYVAWVNVQAGNQ